MKGRFLIYIIYKERKKLGSFLFPKVLKSIKSDLKNTVFSYIPNTAETSFYGLIGAVQDHLKNKINKELVAQMTLLV